MEQIDGLEIKLWSPDETCEQDEEDQGRPLTDTHTVSLTHTHKHICTHTNA